MRIKIMETKKTNTFSTDNFLLACYLTSQSCHLVSIDKTNIKRQVFIFQESKNRVSLSEKFLAHEAYIEVHRFSSAQRDLKQMIHQNYEQRD